jgi:hypothetical protein
MRKASFAVQVTEPWNKLSAEQKNAFSSKISKESGSETIKDQFSMVGG